MVVSTHARAAGSSAFNGDFLEEVCATPGEDVCDELLLCERRFLAIKIVTGSKSRHSTERLLLKRILPVRVALL